MYTLHAEKQIYEAQMISNSIITKHWTLKIIFSRYSLSWIKVQRDRRLTKLVYRELETAKHPGILFHPLLGNITAMTPVLPWLFVVAVVQPPETAYTTAGPSALHLGLRGTSWAFCLRSPVHSFLVPPERDAGGRYGVETSADSPAIESHIIWSQNRNQYSQVYRTLLSTGLSFSNKQIRLGKIATANSPAWFEKKRISLRTQK